MITKDWIIRKKWNPGFERPHGEPSEIVIHATAGSGVLKWMQTSSERADQWMAGIALFHYLIDLSGNIIELIDPDRWVYHSSSGIHDKESIGIELEKKDSKNESEISTKQMASLVELVDYLSNRYKIERIVSHDYNARVFSNRAPKPCPGTFDWELLGSLIENKKADIQS